MTTTLGASSTVSKPGHDGDQPENVDADNPIGTEEDVREVLRMLSERPNLHLTKEQAGQINDPKVTTFEKLFTQWNKDMAENYAKDEDEEERELREAKEASLLEKADQGRPQWLNRTLGPAYYLLVTINFYFALSESYNIIVESAKLDNMSLRGMFQCLEIPKNQNFLLHCVNICQALVCVLVLYARSKKTANLCWLYLMGSTINACFRLYRLIYSSRFEYDKKLRGTMNHGLILIVLVVVVNIPAMTLVLLRYYDLTQQFVTRAQDFATQTYEGRQLNDKIIYKNVSSFLQRKTVLRSCTSLQIFNTVEKIQEHQSKLKKGEEISEEFVKREVKAAITALKEVENLGGMEMLRELKRRQYENVEELEDDESTSQGKQSYAFEGESENPDEGEEPFAFVKKLSDAGTELSV